MRLGLTGGIASGKSTVSNYLHDRYDIPILSADRYAHFVLENLVKEAVIDRYGLGIVREAKIDRQKLGEIVFTKPEERIWLENKLHPIVKEQLLQDLQKNGANIIAVEIPLLFEAKMTDLVDQIWVVTCSEQKSIERLQKRNNLKIEECQDRIKAQMPITEKCKLADVVLHNDSTLEDLYEQIDKAYQLALSQFN